MPGGRKRKGTETVFKRALIPFLLTMMWVSRDYPEKSRLFPMIIFGVTILLILGSFLQDAVSRNAPEEALKAPAPSPLASREEKLRRIKELEEQGESDAGYEMLEESLRKKRLRQAIVIIFISLGIGYLGGFLLTVPFFFVAFGILHGKKGHALRYIGIAAGTTIVIYLFFTSLMSVPLLRGLWWG